MASEKRMAELKKQMLEWTDNYGQDIAATDRIEAATTVKELHDIMEEHREFLDQQVNDAQVSLDKDVSRMFKGLEDEY